MLDKYLGKFPATRLTKGVFYIAWLSMMPNFFNASWHGRAWMNYSMPLVLLSFLSVGLFSIFASREGLIDFWQSNTRLGRDLTDPIKASLTIRTFRITGIVFVLFVAYISYTMFHLSPKP